MKIEIQREMVRILLYCSNWTFFRSHSFQSQAMSNKTSRDQAQSFLMAEISSWCRGESSFTLENYKCFYLKEKRPMVWRKYRGQSLPFLVLVDGGHKTEEREKKINNNLLYCLTLFWAAYLFFFLTYPYSNCEEGGIIIEPTLQMRKLGHRVV